MFLEAYRVKFLKDKEAELTKRYAAVPSNLHDTNMVILLDCWNINTSKEFRAWVSDTYPCIRLRYIPAGMTGKAQINDTMLHAPFKVYVRRLCERWYEDKVIFFI